MNKKKAVLAVIGHDLEYLRSAIESATQKEDDKRFKTKYYFENLYTSDQVYSEPKLNLTQIKLKCKLLNKKPYHYFKND